MSLRKPPDVKASRPRVPRVPRDVARARRDAVPPREDMPRATRADRAEQQLRLRRLSAGYA